MGGIHYHRAFLMCMSYEAAFESILYEVIFYLYFILDLMKEWSAFNGQGSESVLRIWQLLAAFMTL